MYTIIGGDGKEYGPVPADQVRAWIGAGRANLDTRAKFLGTDEWKSLADFADFAEGNPPPFSAESGPAPAERILRLGAALLDSVAAMVFAAPGTAMIGFGALRNLLEGDVPQNAAAMNPGYSVLAAAMLALLAVQTWLLSTRGQTIGKMLLKIRIVRFRDGAPPGFLRAVLLRGWIPALFATVPVVGPIFALVDILFIFGQRRRCLHDLIAGTKVVAAA